MPSGMRIFPETYAPSLRGRGEIGVDVDDVSRDLCQTLQARDIDVDGGAADTERKSFRQEHGAVHPGEIRTDGVCLDLLHGLHLLVA